MSIQWVAFSRIQSIAHLTPGYDWLTLAHVIIYYAFTYCHTVFIFSARWATSPWTYWTLQILRANDRLY